MNDNRAPTVSVIVPNYNHAPFLRQRIDTILAQTYGDFELILLDDCSTDDSRNILNEYSYDFRVTHLEFNDKNSGSTFKQWNKGVRLARGKYVWIAESDDYADRNFLETLIARLEATPDAALCYCRSYAVSPDGTVTGLLDSYLRHLNAQRWANDFAADGPTECRKYLTHCNTVQSASSVVFLRDAYWRSEGADETLTLCGDWKMWVSMAVSGGTICHVGQPLSYCRTHAENVSTRSLRNGVWAAESLRVVKWAIDRAAINQQDATRVYEELAALWVPAVLSRHVAPGMRLQILKSAASVDAHALRRLYETAPSVLRLAIGRRWRHWRAAASAR
jgi:hypothetical protein